jgi:hypothetical protein
MVCLQLVCQFAIAWVPVVNNKEYSMKKLVACLTASAVMAFGASAALASMSGSQAQLQSIDKKVGSKKGVSWLFVVSAGEGKVKKSKTEGEYVLQFDVPAVNQVTMFSDRPNRLVRVISGQALKTKWSHGLDSFHKDPPNAVLSASNMEPVVVTLMATKVKGSHIVYRFKVVKGDEQVPLKENLSKVVLTIDDSTAQVTNCAASTVSGIGMLFSGCSLDEDIHDVTVGIKEASDVATGYHGH